MIRIQSQEIASLRGDVDTANMAVNSLRIQVQAIQVAYQVRDVLRQEADDVASKRSQVLDAASSDWADCLLPSDIGSMFGKTDAAGNSDSSSGESVSGITGAAVDASNK